MLKLVEVENAVFSGSVICFALSSFAIISLKTKKLDSFPGPHTMFIFVLVPTYYMSVRGGGG